MIAQRAYDPYGADDKGGSSKLTGEEKSTLGFQSSMSDKETGNLLLGPRIYDPTTDRFTTADTFVASDADLALGTDPLTGNRYVFAAANPVAFYENGYDPCYDASGGLFGSGGGGLLGVLIFRDTGIPYPYDSTDYAGSIRDWACAPGQYPVTGCE